MKEYRDLKDSDARAIETVLNSKPSKLYPARIFYLVHESGGYRCAGSAAILVKQSWRIKHFDNYDNAWHSSHHKTLSEAQQRFDYLTDPKWGIDNA
jgi:hypothetical protein